jgi:hypothetical protein
VLLEAGMDVSLENVSQPTEAQPHSVVIRLGEGHITSLIRTTFFSNEDFSDQGITTEHAKSILKAGGNKATNLLSYFDQELATHQAIIKSAQDTINSVAATDKFDDEQKKLITAKKEKQISQARAHLQEQQPIILSLFDVDIAPLLIDPQNQKYMENIKKRIA